jgi:cell surface protein SprA
MSIEYAMRRSITLNNIRITGGEALNKLGPIAPGNFTFGYSFNESLMHNINTERDYEKDNTITGAYVFGTKAYSFEPFKSSPIKSEWFKIIKDFNLALYPNQLGFSTDYNDKYTEYIVRSFYPGVIIQPIQYRERINNRNYMLSWDITQRLKFTFNAINSSRQDISMGHDSDTLDLDQSWRNTHYGHDYNISYTLPINKLPIFSWTNVVATYKATYDWDAPATVATGDMPYVGNTIRNSNNFQVNTTLNFVNLYGKSKLLKEINQKFSGRSSNKNRKMKDVTFEKEEMNFTSGRKTTVKHNLKTRTAIKVKVLTAEGTEVKVTTKVVDERNVEITTNQDIKQGKIIVTGQVPVPENPFVYAGKLSLRLLMSIQNINLSYTRGGETTLPGYTPQTTIIGLDKRHNFNAPGWDFILGSQSHNFWGNFYGNSSEYMLGRAHARSWVIQDTSTFIDPFNMRMNTNLTFRSSIEPVRDLRIDITASHSYSNSKVWYDINYPGNHIATESGSFTMSTIAIGSAFENPKSETYYKSDSYNKFANSRLEIANMLAADYYGSNSIIPRDSLGFPAGFSGLSQDVLMPAFAVGYLGKPVDSKTKNYTDFLSKIPLPNWQITYSGLSRISALKPFIKSANISHSYRATYSIGSYTTNTKFLENPTGFDDNEDFHTKLSITSASLTETIQLGSLDVTWANSLQTRFEVRKNRRIELSLNNNQIVENGSWEGTAGVGYTFTNVPQILTFGDKAETTSITLRADFTFREDKNIIRKLAEDTHQITNGQRNMAAKFTSDYLLMKDLTFRIYFDWIKNNPYVSGVNTSNIAFGFSLRYVLGL